MILRILPFFFHDYVARDHDLKLLEQRLAHARQLCLLNQGRSSML